MTSGQLDLKELDLEGFLDSNFDEIPGFPWVSAANSGSMGEVPSVFGALPPPPGSAGLLDFSFDPTAQQPPQLTSVPLQHRLLTDKGLAYTLPDLMAAAGAGAFPSEPQREKLSSCGSGELGGGSKTSELGVNKGKTQLSLAERNKQAQRRHRQRQRDRMEMLESQVKKLQEEKQALNAEKAALAGQAAVLTQVLQMRDEQLQQVKATSAAQRPLGSKDAEAEPMSRKESAVSSGLADSLAAILTLTVREENKIHLTPEQVRAMAPQDVARMWAEYMSALMKQLSAAEGAPPQSLTRIEARISELLQEVLVLLMRYALGDLHKMKRFVAGKASKATAPVGLEGSDVWRAAARNLDLSDAQKKALLQLRQLFLAKQEALLSQRADAIAVLQRTMPNVASSHDIAAKFLEAEEAMTRIHDNLRMENQLIVDLIYTLLIKISSPVQAARCLVQSFPWYPDSLCILTWIAAEAGDRQAKQLLNLPEESASYGAANSEQDSAGGTPEIAPASPSHSS